MTFLLSEDKALRLALQGMTVQDQKSDGDAIPRQVGVWFGQPDQELRAQSYPYVTIDVIDVNRDPEREMRGKVSPVYLTPESLNENQAFEIDMPIPVNIDYQITVYSRQPRHDREIIAQLMYQKLPLRNGVLEIEDGTLRRMDVLGVSKRDVTEQGKRLFVNAVTVRVSSEVAQGIVKQLYKVLEVNVDDLNAVDAGGRTGDPHYISPGSFTISR
ncbi:hypothetical protein UFOVP46_22 [uncultured Caudovirales phage]|uniref:Uncharacterized protein n=1 Tax=uncultured Caudovirales phage TaxID=2100421 RepID=A0A6J5KNT1_9CAUD|nr:hypothetical protein UFOVP46_22 [uncultured Caudovirales phage]